MTKSKALKERVRGFKGFNKNLSCSPMSNIKKTYKPGHKYHINGDIKLCSRGFHFCKWPVDIFRYYNPVCNSRYFRVSGSGKYDVWRNDTKIAVENLYVSTSELSWKDIIRESKIIADNKNKPKSFNLLSKARDLLITSKPYQGLSINVGASIGITRDSQSYITIIKNYSMGITNGSNSISESISRESICCNLNNESYSILHSTKSVAICNGMFSTAISDAPNNVTITKAPESYSLLTDKSDCSISIISRNSVAKSLGDNNIIIDNRLYEDASYDTSIIDLHGKNNIAISYHLNNFFRAAQKDSMLIIIDYDTNTSRIIKADGENVKLNTWYTIPFTYAKTINFREANESEKRYLRDKMQEY